MKVKGFYRPFTFFDVEIEKYYNFLKDDLSPYLFAFLCNIYKYTFKHTWK